MREAEAGLSETVDRALVTENTWLKRLVAELPLEKRVLRDMVLEQSAGPSAAIVECGRDCVLRTRSRPSIRWGAIRRSCCSISGGTRNRFLTQGNQSGNSACSRTEQG